LKEGVAGRTYLRQPGKCLKDLRVGLWNVLSLYKAGALKMLLEQLDSYKLDITAIQELRWLDRRVMEERNHVIFYNCQKKSHMFGTGFIVSKKLSTLF
jgi:exonuclease III